jgi:hypothetical protein
MARQPAFDPAPAGGQVGRQVVGERGRQQAAHRLQAHAFGAVIALHDRAAGIVQAGGEALDQVERQLRRVAGHDRDPRRRRRAQSRQYARQRAREVAGRVGENRGGARGVLGCVAVGADHERAHLRRQPRDRMVDQGPAVPELQALVDAPHPLAAAAGQDQAGDAGAGRRRSHQPPM